jgi:hypothetical protein
MAVVRYDVSLYYHWIQPTQFRGHNYWVTVQPAMRGLYTVFTTSFAYYFTVHTRFPFFVNIFLP